MSLDKKYQEKKSYFDRLKNRYQKEGEITWEQFASNQKSYSGHVVLLENDDLKNGTLRVQQPCMLKLKENIAFNPNRPKTWLDKDGNVTINFDRAESIDPNRQLDWMPSKDGQDNDQYFQPEVRFAYSLGFFAAIAIESDNVLIDLNGYSIYQHREHALQQRFFANIELADQPFIPMQGPSNFGATLRTAKNVYIHNGKIGRSSHHGIHGNGADNILLENLVFEDFEVAGPALNGSKNISIKDVTIKGNRKDIPVLGTYSAARFIKSFVKKVQDSGHSYYKLDNAYNNLKEEMDKTFNAHIFEKCSIPSLFKNSSGLVDGNPYGIVLNTKGVAVNGFLEDRDSDMANYCSNVYLDNVSVNGIHGNINEIVTLSTRGDGSGNPQMDTAGAKLQFFNHVSQRVGGKYYYKGTVLSEVQIELAKVKAMLDEQGKNTKFFGTLNITKGIQIWKDDSSKYFVVNSDKKLELKNSDGSTTVIDGKEVVYDILCNGDTMFHVNKGVIGLRIDGANHLSINNVSVTDIKNIGNRGSHIAGAYLKSHPAQGSLVGYQGAKTYGAILCAINDLKMSNSVINRIESKHGYSGGLNLMNGSTNLSVDNVKIQNIKSATEQTYGDFNYGLPNELPKATGLYIDSDLFNVNLRNVEIKGLMNMKDYPYKEQPCSINSPVNFN